MHEPGQAEAPSRGRGVFALLRLRLWLALLIMAVVPLTVASATLYAAVSNQALGPQYGALAASGAVSARLQVELDRIAGAMRLLSISGGLSEVVGAPVGGQSGDGLAARRAADSMRAAAEVGGPAVSSIWASSAAADRRVGLDNGRWTVVPDDRLRPVDVDQAARRLPPGAIHVSAPYEDPERGLLVSVVGPLHRADGRVVALLQFEITLERLVAEVASGVVPPDGHLALVDASGRVLAVRSRVAEGGLPIGAGVPAPLTTAQDDAATLARLAAQDRAAADEQRTGGWATASTAVAMASDPTAQWSVIAFYPVGAAAVPLELVVLLAALGTTLMVLAFWLSRQVLRPAEELERSRAELHRMYEAARAASLHDALTGLGNHRAFQEELERQIEAQRRYGVPVALLLADLDDLKLVNDSAGHAAGDDQLREMGQLINGIVRYADRAFRIGGDEFAILMPHTDVEGALVLGRRLLQQALSEPEQPIPFSGGVSSCPALASDRDQLYAQADAALYWCKRHGRGALAAFDPLRDGSVNQPALGGQAMPIARVIGQRLLRAVYQPVVDLRSGVVVGFEGLTRPLPQTGYANPGVLFAAAEAAGRTVELDGACLEVILAQAAGLDPTQQLSINLSPSTIEAPHFSAEWLLARAARHGFAARQLIVELTEHDHVADLERVRQNLAALQRHGVRVAIDDVGAGNAGLRMLSQFRFDVVKIDLSLVQDGTLRDSSRAVVRSLSELAGRWNAYVVAEGIETVDQLRAVRELGIAAGQGFILGRPTPKPSLTRVDLGAVEAGGVVMEVHRQPDGPALRRAPAPQPGMP